MFDEEREELAPDEVNELDPNQATDSQKVWQVAAGSDQRDYADEFLRFGLAFVGGEKQMAALAQVRPGDLLVLKRGKSAVIAVGEAVERGESHFGNGDKPWLRDFDGWDLPAYVRVDWRRPITNVPAEGLTIGTIKRVNTPSLRRAAEVAYAGGVPVGKPLADPPATRGVPDSEILEFLVSEGLRPSLAEELTAAFARIRLLARYYRSDRRYWDHVREHETRTFLVAPLLLALGWAEQQIKIELKATRGERQGRIDMALFARPYRLDERGNTNDADCTLIVETKGLAQGLTYAHGQAKDYAAQFPSCRAVVVTNGYCYKVFKRGDEGFSATPDAYLNLLDPRDRYPLDPERVAGALETLRYLMPSWWR